MFQQHVPPSPLMGSTKIIVRQKREVAEILTGFETRNRYEIDLTGEGMPSLFAMEGGSGAGRFLLRQFAGNKRPFTIEVRDRAGALVLQIKRPWRWFFSRAEILDGSGRAIGAIQQRWSLFRRLYSVEGPGGRQIAELFGPFFRPWTFEIMTGGTRQGKIFKKWSGLLTEAFTQADHFGLELSPQVDEELKSLCLGATFLIDFVHFEKR